MYKSISHVLLFILLFSCAKEEIGVQKATQGDEVPDTIKSSMFACSDHTKIKPPVDLLFVWDNSTSSTFLNSYTKTALQGTIDLVSKDFDYHIMIAPLHPSNTEGRHPVIVSDPEGLSSSVISNRLVASDQINFFNSTAGSSLEAGFDRVHDLIFTENAAISGVFRRSAYTIVILISNGDDNKYMEGQPHYNPALDAADYAIRLDNFIRLKNDLNSTQFRFISVVAHNDGISCHGSGGTKIGDRYRRMSNSLYSTSGSDDQSGSSHPDSYDLCNTSFLNLFDGVNQTIQAIIQPHQYNYWAISKDPVNPSSIEVTKNNGTKLIKDDPNGFRYIGFQTNRNRRILPSPGEPYTGYMIELLGSGQVTYPECVVVKSNTPTEYYGFIALDKRPQIDTVHIWINGQEIPQSSSNGWTLYSNNFIASKNIKVKSPSEPHIGGSPADYRSGYFLELHGTAIYDSGSSVSSSYLPAPL